jgi:Flp pilus assembly protein TadD
LVEQGIALYMDGDLEEAEEKYQEALQRRHDDAAALYNLGVLLRVTGRRGEARRHFETAAQGDPEHPDVRRAAEALDKLNRRRDL